LGGHCSHRLKPLSFVARNLFGAHVLFVRFVSWGVVVVVRSISADAWELAVRLWRRVRRRSWIFILVQNFVG